MKRLICILLVLLLLAGCGQRTISPSTGNDIAEPTKKTPIPTLTAEPLESSSTPGATDIPKVTLPAFAPGANVEPFFAEEVLSQDGEPILSLVNALLQGKHLSKRYFSESFSTIISKTVDLDKTLCSLIDEGRTLSSKRRESTIVALTQLISDGMLADLEQAYSECTGEGEPLPIAVYRESIDALLQDLASMEERTLTFFALDKKSPMEYKAVLSRYMGETIDPDTVLNALEELAQTEAYALNTAIQADPEVVRKKEPISLESFSRNLSLLREITQDLCPLPNGTTLPIPNGLESEREMDLLQLAFRYYPGMAYLRAYGAQASEEQQQRWVNAPDGYLAGLAVHGSYAVVPYLDGFELEYVQYRWYEEMLYKTLTGISSVLIHYYGYSMTDLAEYLKSWGADSFTEYLYEGAMFDPFECVIASYGYYQYLNICQAALDAGCENEQRFLQDYLAAGPVPFRELKEYMVGLYQNQG